ncbi:MAG: aminotransferase class I/II-fold pyridoxal phosphate-dependent enzyme [Spirochaetales bacterium]|jgi:DNA-binding transcriptional MocR family regulator|nr:aminotransferase class I/II-fold pyridoxal phosphate-dependent enzyme [Spirochaetales bacterium]
METLDELKVRIEKIRSQSLSLDLTRGKPGPEQLDIAVNMFSCVNSETFLAEGSVDTRNYGVLDGIAEAKGLFSEYLGVGIDEIIIAGNSSLALMYDTFAQLMTHGSAISAEPWMGRKNKLICPVPGYDRHFTICQRFGIEMITVPMTENGPDVDEIEKLITADDTIRGMWCVPRYSNPTGYTCSPEVVRALADLKPGSDDFLIFWDDAYAVHHFGGGPEPLESLLDACKSAGNPERALIFGSTSKISFAGAGLAMMGGSTASCAWAKERMFAQTIGYDKINMLRHVRFFGNLNGVLTHMDKHAAIVAPKFQAVEEILTAELGESVAGTGLAEWTHPSGGYFVSLDTKDGCASEVIKLAGELGVKLTPAGSTFPHKKDPQDRNIRIAPTFPVLDDVKTAVKVLAVCIKFVSLGKS